MFTGIVEEIGTIEEIKKGQASSILRIKAQKVLHETNIGDSIAVNGICLTVVRIEKDIFEADVMSETLQRTTIKHLIKGSFVNLERAMRADGRFGGHIVSGHIDGTGIIKEIKKDDNAIWYTIASDKDILKYVVEKGSIAIDGISLTVAYVDDNIFKVSVIPHTIEVTALSKKNVSSEVNLECDIISKYLEKMLIKSEADVTTKKSKVTEEFLIENGFY